MRKPIVEIRNVKIHRNNRLVLNIEHLAIQQGEMVAVVGPNGAGKSTLLQLVNLLTPYQEGEVKLFGSNVKEMNTLSLRRRCAMVFQDSLLLNDTVFNNVALALRFRGSSAKKIKEEVCSALTAFRCLHLIDRAAHSLSGGEAQRVCLARAMVHQPELLLLDEPFVALDTPTRIALLADIKRVAQSCGMTVILVNHNYDDVLYFAERAIVFLSGQVAQDNRPEMILRQPVNRAVADLTGMDNILPCRIAKTKNVLVCLSDDLSFSYPGNVLPSATTCCLPGDILHIMDEGLVGQHDKMVVLRGIVHQIIPGVGIYQVVVDVQGLILTLRVPRERVVDWLKLKMLIQVAFDPRDAHIV
ncbi:MAG: Polyamine-transporting ATPase [Pelosinus sp.]|jgi:tungstate transport system ATP-binding protein|nr:Polyamine-transporting ATPase [Pelosinus sp.]